MWRVLRILPAVPLALFGVAASAATPERTVAEIGAALAAAYPDHIERVDGTDILWRDGARTPIDDGEPAKPFDTWLARPSLRDVFRYPYVAGASAVPPGPDVDPGRARPAVLFDKMYGRCQGPATGASTADVVWLPTKAGQKLRVTTVNGVDRRLAAVSAELDKLPTTFDVFLKPSAGTINCRPIAGTNRPSAHGYGIAIDIAVARADYWAWAKPAGGGVITYKNRVPIEIVQVFEAHGFIWGGKWHHYDTMHFEYRPELLPPLAPLPSK
jgi:D-alanyl-D-alanine carboxypeptidase